ncbi:polysaccharide lyase family 4 protein [Plicaturopsis crispa FD-325 SS-3]|nr:polysaccharide lyase family 4 protein [Plicaturopsis crispa FD-325 SS-3]
MKFISLFAALAFLFSYATSAAYAAFGITDNDSNFVVDTGGGLVFTVNTANGDITSLKYAGYECQDQTKFSQLSSGLGSATVTYKVSGSYIVVFVRTDTLSHYYVAKSGDSTIYMATNIASEPTVGELRWITRLARTAFNDGITAADVNGGTAIEGSDVFSLDGQTRSKFYSSVRFIENQVHGVSGAAGAAWMVVPGTGYESSSGGPFFRDINNQGSAQQELYFYMNSNHEQTEAYRTGLFGPYALVFTSGSKPSSSLDLSFFVDLDIGGAVGASSRGTAKGSISGIPSGFTAVVGFANSKEQYWTTASGSSYTSPLMKASTYTVTLYKGELEVATSSVAVTAGGTTTLNLESAESTPSAIWSIGDADGTPSGFLNADKIETMHPSDSRMSSWGPVTFTVGSSSVSSFPMAQFVDVNNPTTIKSTLTSSQIGARTLRIRTTSAFAGGRPQVTVNSWTSSIPAAPTAVDSRGVTRGTWRGINELYEYAIPSGTLVAGSNTITINIVSGSSGDDFLSPNVVYDSIELY